MEKVKLMLDGPESEIPVYSRTCLDCIHLRDRRGDERKCDAFPNGIPLDIWNGDNPHNTKHPDQKNDIVFEKRIK